MPFFDVVNGTTNGDQSLWNQFADALSAKNDTPISTFAQIAAPGAPSVAINTTAGNLAGAYQYAVAFVTGYWEGPVGTGTFHQQATTEGGTVSAIVSPSNEQVDLSNIPIGGTGVYQRILYRTKAGGTSFFYLDTLADNTTTTYTDNALDSALGAAMPTTNTTGSDMTVGRDLVVTRQFKSVGETTQVTNLNAQYLQGYTPDSAATAGTVPVRDANGNVAENDVIGNTNPNLLFNPTGNLGLAGWSGTGSGWGFYFNEEGQYIYSSLPSATGTWHTLSSAPINVNAGKILTLGADMDTDGLTAGSAWVEVHFFNSSGTEVAAYVQTAEISAGGGVGFVRRYVTFTTPTNTSYIVVRLVTNTTAVGGALWRRIKVEKGSFATTFSDDSTFNTPQYASSLYPSNLSGPNWYQKLPNGFTIMGGSIGFTITPNTYTEATINFQIPFLTKVLSYHATPDVSNGFYPSYVYPYNPTTKGFGAYLYSASSNGYLHVEYTAFGY